MKYAELVRLGGELIEASDADYPDYYGLLVCPECGEPVFLRKSHERSLSEEIEEIEENLIMVKDHFVHHKVTAYNLGCKMRTKIYAKEKEEQLKQEAKKAHDQRLNLLRISMWKYLASNSAISLKLYSKAVKFIQEESSLRRYTSIAESFFDTKALKNYSNTDKPFLNIIKIVETYSVIWAKENFTVVVDFKESHKTTWPFHLKVTNEAFDLFSESKAMKPIRHRLICLATSQLWSNHIRINNIDLMKLTIDEEVAEFYLNKLLQYIGVVFLTVDWQIVLKSK